MKKDDTTPYHHGNLRAELLKTAAQELQSVGVEKLSMRAVSRALGVSQSAPFRHFKNKNELLTALVEKGFSQLAQYQRRAKKDLTPTEALLAMGIAYVNFACTHPELFKLMFSSQIYCEQNDGLSESKGEAFSGGEAFNALLGIVEEGIQQGYFHERPVQEVAFAAWSIVHGLAYLTIDYSRIGIPKDATHHLVQSALDVFMRGVSAEEK